MKHARMFRLAAAVLTLLALALPLASCSKGGEFAPPAGYQAAADEKADFHFYVPDKWTVDYSTAAAGAYYSASDPSSVSVMAWELPHTDTTLDEWWALNREEIEQVFDDFNLESEENMTVDGLYAKKYVYTASLGGYAYRYQQVAAIKGTSVYLFTYASTEENYETHLDEVNEMLGYWLLK